MINRNSSEFCLCTFTFISPFEHVMMSVTEEEPDMLNLDERKGKLEDENSLGRDVKFYPPLFMQRYSYAANILEKHNVKWVCIVPSYVIAGSMISRYMPGVNRDVYRQFILTYYKTFVCDTFLNSKCKNYH
jgi:hypothetical protein